MNDSERVAIKEMLLRRVVDRVKTPKAARQWLIDEGLYDSDGELRPEYGGARRETSEEK